MPALTRLWIALLLTTSLASAAPPSREQMKASFDAHKSDFDYLLGDWEFTSQDRQWGRGRGYWSAVKLDDGQVLDEYRVVGDKGETYYVTCTLRGFNASTGQWELVSTDAGSGLQNRGTGRKDGGEVHIEQTFGATSDKPAILRIRYYDIQADRFSWNADRSTDGGRTWTKDFTHIEARRIGPPRTLTLTTPRAPAPGTAPPAP